ncbi:hypothetical protein Pla86_38110 [Planctomycetes bacterium Pla86]|uniref:Uncharacterized protein n=1 Tax=Engelhardtia mirabilis TaxID=2528011 RepID=A0A518BP06_9BACT|nr:hypothetical protein Pla133_38120 [Planctomycetes bacterium Pla133]QDV03036.1 hypothetical protein Pla86_38110 [Planctomycetes bacterium Pla86]
MAAVPSAPLCSSPVPSAPLRVADPLHRRPRFSAPGPEQLSTPPHCRGPRGSLSNCSIRRDLPTGGQSHWRRAALAHWRRAALAHWRRAALAHWRRAGVEVFQSGCPPTHWPSASAGSFRLGWMARPGGARGLGRESSTTLIRHRARSPRSGTSPSGYPPGLATHPTLRRSPAPRPELDCDARRPGRTRSRATLELASSAIRSTAHRGRRTKLSSAQPSSAEPHPPPVWTDASDCHGSRLRT